MEYCDRYCVDIVNVIDIILIGAKTEKFLIFIQLTNLKKTVCKYSLHYKILVYMHV